MIARRFKNILLICLSMLFASIECLADADKDERHIQVAMRMVGHELLLSAGDSVSVVSPIEKEGDQYKIQFANEFEFNPEILKAIVDSVFAEARINRGYILEVENNATSLIVYSYEVGNHIDTNLVPCGTRPQPKASYSVLLTLLDEVQPPTQAEPMPVSTSEVTQEDNSAVYLVIGGALLLILGGLIFLVRRKKDAPKADSNTIVLGAYKFDTRNLNLYFDNETTELTGKEADLLSLLHASANTTLRREDILKNVWGDEGDYVGRTLDVFISKLRKKLEADASVKIVNIRGVGYKLILND